MPRSRTSHKARSGLTGRLTEPRVLQGTLIDSDYFSRFPASKLERDALAAIEHAGIPTPELQYRGLPPRRFLFDFAWVEQRIAVEINGGTWAKGKTGHNSGSGLQADMTKLNCAALAGWVVLVYTDHGIKDGSLVADVRRALEMRSHATTDCSQAPDVSSR